MFTFQTRKNIVITMNDPLYYLIDWSWRTIPGFRRLHDDTKACISLIAFNVGLVIFAVAVMSLTKPT